MLQVLWWQLRQSSISLFSPGALHLKSVCGLHFMEAVAEEAGAKAGQSLLVWIRWTR